MVRTKEHTMPKDKDLKRLIRARMDKTGESYTAARAHVVGAPPAPLPEDHETVAGMRDEKVADATGRTWPEWVTDSRNDPSGPASYCKSVERTRQGVAPSESNEWNISTRRHRR